MAAKAAKKKPTKDAPAKDASKQDTPKKKADAATSPENQAHHATLRETACSDCAVGLLKQFASESLRNQKKLDPGNHRFHLQDDEELELLRTNPLTLQLVGLRRERSLTNRFDDLLVVLYDPALLKEGEKTVLEAEGLRAENLKDAQAYVDAVLAEKEWPVPKNWPFPGVDVSCPQCKHWRVAVLPITTEPGYDKDKPFLKDDKGNKLPDFDNLTLLPHDVGAIAPGIYNGYYRVGIHKGASNPPTSYAALQFAAPSIPARRRYPVSDFLNAAQAAHDFGQDKVFCAKFASEDAEAQKEARTKLEAELGEKQPRTTRKQREAFALAVEAALEARNLEFYKPRIAEQRKQRAREMLDAWVNGSAAMELERKIDAGERFIRLEDAGAETQNFEAEDNQVSHLEVLDDEEAPMKVGLQFVFKAPSPPPAQPPASGTAPTPPAPTAAPGLPAAPTPPPPSRTLRLTKDHVLVTFGTAGATNIHRSVDGESGSWRRGREVNDFSEGCQVFRSPDDFRDFTRLAMLSKRAHCPSRKASCCEKLTVEDVEKAISRKMTEFLCKCPGVFAVGARRAITDAFTPPPPPPLTETAPEPEAAGAPTEPDPTAVTPPPEPDLKFVAAVEKLLDERISNEGFDKKMRAIFFKVFPNKTYDSAENFALLKTYTREAVLAGLLPEDDVKKAVEGAPQDPKEARAFDKSLEKTFKNAIQTGLENLRTKLTETKDGWVKEQHDFEILQRLTDYLKDGLEPCDFGACGFRFDYMLAETTRANMEAFVSRLGGREWNALFPEDAPPPPPPSPKPKKQPPSKSAGKKGKPLPPSAGAPK
ncbi:hypothetical protein [Pyxidicoccus xibeiensis]|uniref:hypothetical protein n=1 Tax=Pyxidicoccus xibeiensis TaxID=2906759 RepID=UPI0020A797F1|nr:hypothetical protein [Pyxidicoccus xibeiensis]MCP3136402.1 hypothetical protein [Pyxidicoccus xibeiensis]